MKLSNFQAFWLGLNTERKAKNLPNVLFGEARILWEEAVEASEWSAARSHDLTLQGRA